MSNAYMFHIARCEAKCIKPLSYMAFIKLLDKLETP